MDMQQTNTQSTPSPDNRKIWRGLFTIIMIIFFLGLYRFGGVFEQWAE